MSNAIFKGINFEEIKEGAVYKNYKDLCLSFGVTPKDGNTKKAIIKRLNEYFELEENTGHKIIIKKSKNNFDKEIPKAGAPSFNRETLRKLVMSMLLENTENNYFTHQQIALSLGLPDINRNKGLFDKKNKEHLQIVSKLNLGAFVVEEFVKAVYDFSKNQIDSTLDSLQQTENIHWEKVVIIRSQNQKNRVADEYEKYLIEDTERKLRLYLSKNKQTQNMNQAKFNKMVSDYLEDTIDISGYHRERNIVGVWDDNYSVISSYELMQLRKTVYNNSVAKIKTNLERRYLEGLRLLEENNYSEKLSTFGNTKKEIERYSKKTIKGTKDYIEDVNTLIELISN